MEDQARIRKENWQSRMDSKSWSLATADHAYMSNNLRAHLDKDYSTDKAIYFSEK